MSMADDHRDWHTMAYAEGVNAWDCPWDCAEAMAEDDAGLPLYATVWYVVPGSTEPTGYPVFSRDQARAFATVAAARTGKAVRVEIAH